MHTHTSFIGVHSIRVEGNGGGGGGLVPEDMWRDVMFLCPDQMLKNCTTKFTGPC